MPRAHQLTHQLERPEKCPISTCEYSKKGFARKYDCQRHTLTHYKGTMVCGFCPGSGSAMEKSFNRADVFKRHLMAVHNVEQTPPNGRKKASGKQSAQDYETGGGDGFGGTRTTLATGKCSTCGLTFGNAQQFYEHLDECVLSKVVQEEPAAAFNEHNLDSVKPEDVEAALARSSSSGSSSSLSAKRSRHDLSDPEDAAAADDDDDYMDADFDDLDDDGKDETFTMGPARGNKALRTPATRSRSGGARA